MESLEGKRGYPRIRPPFPAVVGLYGSPTVINNVETLSAVPAILRRGGEWYAGLGSRKMAARGFARHDRHPRDRSRHETPLSAHPDVLEARFHHPARHRSGPRADAGLAPFRYY